MISFRFHLVSLVGIFLALGLGVLMGTTVLNRGIVSQLERQTEQLAADAETLRTEVRELQAQSDVWARFGDQAMPYLVSDRLPRQDVVVVTQQHAEEGVGAVQRALDEAGARVVTVLSVGQRMSLPTASDREALAAVVGTTSTDPEEVRVRAAEELATRLAFGPRGVDVLQELIADEFVLNLGQPLDAAGLRQLARADLVLVVAGGSEQIAPPPERFLVPLVTELAGTGTAVAAAETSTTGYEFVTVLRGDGAVSDAIVTHDIVDQAPGQAGLVLAVEDLLDEGQAGHYGIKTGASSVIPPQEE